MIIYGINPIIEALRAGERRFVRIILSGGRDRKGIKEIIHLAQERGIRIDEKVVGDIDKICGSLPHQGVVGIVSEKEVVSLDELIDLSFKEEREPTIVILDGVEDPRNLGSIIRSAEVFGMRGVIIPKDRSVGLTATVAKASAGALEYIPITKVTNIAQVIEVLKRRGFWVVGIDMKGETKSYSFRFEGPIALVIGGESRGIRRLVERRCDFLISIPMIGRINSLNVAVASAIIFYEILRQRTVERG
ncbi:MAG: 23S rRNA (guanosine(2251)-2'-O)-methyltransferase RlmB [Nitrospinae bacterium]|nr:23S rRNA (guanosine(2251)-2'-O)-methyltransferase RlmB [Nitrospinota bacterium]